MGQAAKVTAKTPEAKRGNSSSQTKNINLTQSISTPTDQIFFLQRTIGNQAVQGLLKSGVIQAKLTIGQPGDIYEQEADRVAEQVMRMPDPDVGGETSVSIQTQVPHVQRMCTECEEELHGHAGGIHIQRVCTECEEELHRQPVEKGDFIQTKPLFRQATPSLVQRQVEREEEEEMVQTKEGSETQMPGAGFETQLNTEKAGGSPLPTDTRQFMDSRFDVDFSQVRIHSNERAARLSRAVHAQAFTVGSDIYFGAGQYNPNSFHGKNLIAHELVHTLQQNPNRLRNRRISSKELNGDNPDGKLSNILINRRLQACSVRTISQKPGAANIQRFYTFAPEPGERRPKGTTIHSLVLPMFVQENSDLFIEVKIPGAKKFDVDAEKAGIADFYRAKPPKTVGIIYQDDQFKYLDNRRRGAPLQWGGGDYDHSEEAAPVGPRGKSKGCDDNNEAQICRLDTAPENISLGDLKPGGSSEAILGEGQIKDYISGLTETSSKVNDFIHNNPDKVHPTPKKWVPLGGDTRITGLTIPPVLEYPTGDGLILKGLKSSKLSVYEGNRKVVDDSGLWGGLYVYKDTPKGVWSYEWFPAPSTRVEYVKVDENVNKALNRLNNEVIPHLQRKHDPSSPSTSGTVRRTGISIIHNKSATIQRQPKPGSSFDLKDWETKHYGPWKKDTKALLADKKKLGNAPVYAALVELNQRSPHKLPISEEVKKTGKGLSKLNHWVEWGGLFGKLRGTFGSLFLKIVEAYEKLKKRFDKVPGESTKSFDFGSGPVGAAVKVAFGLMRQFLKIIAGRVAQNLTTRLKTGAEALAKHIFSDSGIEKFMQNFEGLKTEIQKITEIADGLHRQFDAKVDEYLKEYEDEITFLNKIKEGLKTVGDIISIVKWGIRLFHCASPPLLGCIKLAFEKLTTALIEAVVKSCWFQEKAIRPLFNTIKFFKELPQNISDAVVKLLREIIPLSGPELDILLPSKIDVPPGEIGKGELKCAPDKPTPEQKALAELYDKYGDEKMNRMLKLLEAKGIEEGAKLTVSDIQKIGKVMGKLSEDDLKKAEQNPDIFKGSDVGKDLEEVVKDIKSETMKKEFEEATGQIIETAEKTGKIAAFVQDAQRKGFFDKYDWYIQWNEDEVKNNKVSAKYLTVLNGKNVAAFIDIEFIVLDYEKKWFSCRIVNSTYLVNAEGALISPVERKFLEANLEGGGSGSVKK